MFQGFFQSIAIGVRVSLPDDLRVGDFVRVGEHEGAILSINWRATRVSCADGGIAVIPNRALFDSVVKAWRTDALCHAAVDLVVPAQVAPSVAQAALLDVAAGVAGGETPRVRLVATSPDLCTYRVEVAVAGGPSRRRALEDELRVRSWYRVHRGLSVASARGGLLEFIERVPLLAVADPLQLEALARSTESAIFGAGEILFRQGERGDSLAVVRSGELEVSVDAAGTRRVVSVIGVGGYVGERSLLTGEPRSATVTARVDTEIVMITKAGVLELLQRDPALADRIGDEMARRDRESQQMAAEGESGAHRRSFGNRIRTFFGLN